MSDRILNIMDSEVFRARRELRRKIVTRIILDYVLWTAIGIWTLLAVFGFEQFIRWALR